MIIEQIMQRDVITLRKTDTIEAAIEKMSLHRIRHIPIVSEQGSVIGMVTDRDIKSTSPSIFETEKRYQFIQKPVEEIMVGETVTAHPLDFVEEISSVFYEHGIGCLPVVKRGKLVGMITKTDLLRTFVRLTGADQPGSQLEIEVEQITEDLANITAILKDHHIQILSVLVYPHANETSKVLVFRLRTIHADSVMKTIRAKGYKVLWPMEQTLK
ncbi:CBS and ACT domain-containing protein [Bacillus sp. NPDC077027]|uniref:CBS and ACT domain-containing protein n=1 Tax=Bacillus sp. NPDC077027 TaxID=3390548 RepID=UPI003CFCBB0F